MKSYWYIHCTECEHKQYIGADLHEAQAHIADLLANKNAIGITGLGSTLTLLLKFLWLHRGHQVRIATLPNDAETLEAIPEEWEYDKELRDFILPAWENIKPLGPSRATQELRKEIDRWKLAYEQTRDAYHNLHLRLDAETEADRLRIAKEFKEEVEKRGDRLVGPAAVKTEGASGVEPPPPIEDFLDEVKRIEQSLVLPVTALEVEEIDE